ncbi:MAG: histidine kinase [Arachnia sp.]
MTSTRQVPTWVPVVLVGMVGVLYVLDFPDYPPAWVLPLAPVIPTILARKYPMVAGLMLWVIVLPTFAMTEFQPLSMLVAAIWVVFASARHGRPVTVVLSGLSIVAGTSIFLLWVSRTGIANHLRPMIMDLGSWRELAVLVALAPLAVPWGIGLGLRMRASAATQRSRAEAAEEARALAEAEERRQARLANVEAGNAQLARDVHDVVGHSLAVILAQAQASQYLDDTEQLHESMRAIADSSRRSLREIRDLLGHLRDGEPVAQAPDGGLDALIASVAASGAIVETHTVGVPRALPPELEVVAYRVLQEMLTNALRHGDREAPIVVSRVWADRLGIEVRNAVPEEEQTLVGGYRGAGVPGMTNRLAAVGGTFDLSRHRVDGREVVTATAWLPLRDQGGTHP